MSDEGSIYERGGFIVDVVSRRPPRAESCWQCEEPLGTGPEKCLTCTAKRAEDRARVGRDTSTPSDVG